MKRGISILLALKIALSLAACGGGTKGKAFEVSKSAYDNITEACVITETIGSDIYDA